MTAIDLLADFQGRGVRFRPDGEHIEIIAPAGALTDDDVATLRANKAEILAYLTRAAAGTIRNPHVVRARKMPRECIFDGCEGELTRRGDLYYCAACGWHFERRPPTSPGYDVRDLGDGITTSDFLN
ncbi:MAG: hypothetical protein SF339_18335 [Blastocatellia bacterium]|nr:hypothetical protein [Blastocatellia bacterium]